METRRTAFPTLQQGDDRVQTGIPSLDKLIEGGLVRGDTTIVAGQPGTGKTTLGLQFLVHGAVKCGENGVYASVIESGEKLKRNARLKARRLVFDSLSALMTAFESTAEARSFLHIMLKFLEAANCTTLMISEVPWGKQQLGTSFEEFLGDGLIVLESSFDNSRVRRRIYIPKMRGTENRLEGYDYYITREGFALAPTPIPPDKIR